MLEGVLCWPCRDAFRRFHIFTVPLSPLRASFLLGGRNKHMGYEAYQVSLELTLCMSAQCWCGMTAHIAKLLKGLWGTVLLWPRHVRGCMCCWEG